MLPTERRRELYESFRRARHRGTVQNMSPKNRNARSKWGKKVLEWILGLSFVSILSLYFAYKTTGADTLRAEIYEPLYGEVVKIEVAFGDDLLQVVPSSTYASLKQSGKIERLPLSMKTQLNKFYTESGEIKSLGFPVLIKIERTVPAYIEKIRSQAVDQNWRDSVVAQLNHDTNLQALGSTYARFTMSHSGHSLELDIRDPKSWRISGPAAVTWQIHDWLDFPKSAAEIRKSWSDQVFLEFDPKLETWQYRITQEDLTRNHVSLQEFLQPIYLELQNDPDFKQIAVTNADVTKKLQDVKEKLAERINDPKHIADLWGN